MQTLSGILLDTKSTDKKATSFQKLINIFVTVNVCQGATVLLLAYLQYVKDQLAGKSPQFPFSPRHSRLSTISIEAETPLLSGITPDTSTFSRRPTQPEIAQHRAEMKRGKIIAWACVTLVLSAWVLFMGVAWEKLGRRD